MPVTNSSMTLEYPQFSGINNRYASYEQKLFKPLFKSASAQCNNKFSYQLVELTTSGYQPLDAFHSKQFFVDGAGSLQVSTIR